MNYIAYDIGTSTLAARLSSCGRVLDVTRKNPQSAHGADVISRIRFAGTPGGRDRLQREITAALCEMTESLCTQAGIAACDIDGAGVAANTVMTYNLLALDPTPLGHAPFYAERLFGEYISAGALALPLCYDVFIAPAASAFIGGDVIAGAAEQQIHGATLFIDIGTNGEMGLLTKDYATFAATAAGPAFEGASLSCGSPAINGAVCSVGSGGELSTIGGTPPRSLCGSGVIDALAYLFRTGQIDRSGVLAGDGIPLERRYSFADGVYLTGADIREILVAKAAICAGVETLLHEKGLTAPEIDTVLLAGSFGEFISPLSAQAIGLLPGDLAARSRPVGNAALAGAAHCAADGDAALRACALARSAEICSLGGNEFFAEKFICSMEL